MPRMPVPVEIGQDPVGAALFIVWDDDHRSHYAFRTLRERCPCAFCIDEWTGEQRLDPAKVPQGIHPKEIGRVGAYALRFSWSDGHQTGLYTFKFLREICECDDCARRRAAAPPGR